MSSLTISDCTNQRICMLETAKITPNSSQPRRCFDDRGLIALADSIYRHGMLQPISVRKSRDKEHLFVLVAGERRFRAAQLLRMEKVPCVIIDTDEKTSTAMAIIENIQRSDLNIFEEAQAIAALKENYGLTQEQIAMTLSVSQSYVANKLRILRLTPGEQRLILEKRFSERHCRALIRIPDEKQRINALNYIIRNNLNVLATEAYIEKLLEGVEPQNGINRKLKDLRIFYNSIDRAVAAVKGLGVDIISRRTEENGSTVISLIIQNKV